jgi:hypothetical protein
VSLIIAVAIAARPVARKLRASKDDDPPPAGQPAPAVATSRD